MNRRTFLCLPLSVVSPPSDWENELIEMFIADDASLTGIPYYIGADSATGEIDIFSEFQDIKAMMLSSVPKITTG